MLSIKIIDQWADQRQSLETRTPTNIINVKMYHESISQVIKVMMMIIIDDT